MSVDLRQKTGYKYSDLGFYLLKELVERTSQSPIQEYVKESIYQPLGLSKTGYLPRTFYDYKKIAPSERDKYFRNQILQGHVHDMGAAMLGGVGGHAGLFSNAYELGVIMQMLANDGYYGGQQIVPSDIVAQFTTRYHESTRRGLGFDMKELNLNKYKNMAEECSASTFGHLGFTGTCAFVDPEQELVYVFLSNRTYPSMENKKFIRDNYRSKIQSIIYSSITPKTSNDENFNN